jgi:protein-S-isoprenylcysteine O-methyltransferase Ste14
MSDDDSPRPQSRITLQFGRHALTGAPAVAVLLAVLAGIVALVVWRAPHLRFTPLLASGLLWFAFIVYWSAAAAESSRAVSAESKGSRALHQNLLNAGLLLLFLRLPYTTERWVPEGRWPVVVGFVIQVVGFALAVWARRHLGRHWSGAITRKEDHALVRTGPYARLRHPIYSAMLAMYFGCAMISGELHGLLAFAIVGFAYARKIPLEEAVLRAEFGDAWRHYRATTWALVPGVY